MAISFINSARQTGSAVTNFNMTIDVGTGPDRLLVVALMQRGLLAQMRTVTATYNGVSLTVLDPYTTATGVVRAQILFLKNPSSGSNTLAVTFNDTVSQYECQASWYINVDQSSPLDQNTGATGTSNAPTVDVTPTENNELIVGCCIHEDLNALSTGADETAIYNFDNGAWVTSSSYAVQTTAATQAINWSAGTSDIWAVAAASFKEGVVNNPPTVALNTPDLSTLGLTPALEFTGTDAQSDDITYQIQISDRDDFGGDGVLLADNNPGNGGGGVVHPNPDAFATAWTGYIQADDRPGQSFTGEGGILDEIQVNFGPDVDTDGYAQIRVYQHTGTYGTSSAPLNYVPYDETPTPDWIAQSARVYFDTGSAGGWQVFEFTGVDRIRLEAGTYYVFILDWQPNDRLYDNTITTLHDAITPIHPGNVYMDGYSEPNCRPWPTLDMWFKVYEEFQQIDELSSGAGDFVNTVDGGDTDPFTSGQKIAFTVDALDALVDGVTYYWRVRASDPGGSTQWGDWTTARSFTASDSGAIEESITIAITLRCTEPQEIPEIDEAISVGKSLSAIGSELAEVTGEIELERQQAIQATHQVEIEASISVARTAEQGGVSTGEISASATTALTRSLTAGDLLELLAEIAIAAQRTTTAIATLDASGAADFARTVTISGSDIAEVGDAVTLAREQTVSVGTEIPGVDEAITLSSVQSVAPAYDVVLTDGTISLVRNPSIAAAAIGELSNAVSIARTPGITAAGETGGDIEAEITLTRTSAIGAVSDVVLENYVTLARAGGATILSDAEVDALVTLAQALSITANYDVPSVEESIDLAAVYGMDAAAGVLLENTLTIEHILGIANSDNVLIDDLIALDAVLRVFLPRRIGYSRIFVVPPIDRSFVLSKRRVYYYGS